MSLKDIFPETIFDLPRHEQLDKIEEELNEARGVVGDNRRYVGELLDVMQATCTALYRSGLSDAEIEAEIRKVVEKNRARGYYSDSQR